MRSEVCTHDLATGETRVVLAREGRIEAPNWHPDGWLLVNAEGRLWRLPLDAPELVPVPTGGLLACNNDHGFSPDFATIAFSAKSETDGQSCIYTMRGAEPPVRVTRLTPSWWHGWSGDRLLYVAARGGAPILPYSCATDGSDERLLVGGFDHVDGPDATPDGQWVWFNGERDGAVDLWRVRPDGSDLQRMTDGPTVDWFPHPSPDGAHVLWLAYPPGTPGHPADLPVELRLMPASGGEGRTLLAFRGGQGTINVPCWRPDGGAFAFCRYPA